MCPSPPSMASIMTIPSPLSLSSLFLKTLSKPYKTLTLKDPLSSPKSFHFRKKTKIPTPPSQISFSLSENCSFSVSSAEIPRDFVSGIAFLSSILAALVWILESRRKRPLLLPYRSINRQYYDLKRKTVEVGSWKLSLDVLPSIRESYDHPKVLIDPAFLGIVKSADRVVFGGSLCSNYSGLDPIGINSELSDFSDEEEGDFGGSNGSIDHPTVVANLEFLKIVNSADRVAFGGSVCSNYSGLDPIAINSELSDFSDEEEGDFGGLNESIDHLTVGTDLAFLRIVNSADCMAFGSLVFRNYIGLDTIYISSEPSDFSDGEVGEFGGLNASRFGWNPLLLPAVSAACLEIPSSSVIAVTEQEKLPAQGELEAAIPAIAMAAGAFGAITGGVNGGLEMVGFVAVISFLVHDLLWASNRRMLWEDLVKVTDREKFICFLKCRNIMITDLSL